MAYLRVLEDSRTRAFGSGFKYSNELHWMDLSGVRIEVSACINIGADRCRYL